MPRLRAPGVYFEPADPPPRRLAETSTDVAGFVGVAERGPVDVPVRVTTWTQFVTRYGTALPTAFLAYAVKGFFANGGRACWVVRAGDDDGRRASAVLLDRFHRPAYRVAARDPGPAAGFAVRVAPAVGGKFSLTVERHGEPVEVWRDLDPSRWAADGQTLTPRYAADVVNGRGRGDTAPGLPDEADHPDPGSAYIRLEDLRPTDGPADHRPVAVAPSNRNDRATTVGSLGSERPGGPVVARLTLEHLTGEHQPPDLFRGLKALERVEEVSVVAVPDLMWPGVAATDASPRTRPRCHTPPTAEVPAPLRQTVSDDFRPPLSADERRRGQEAIIRHCAALRDRFAVLDTPAGLTTDAAIRWAEPLRSESGQFAGLYHPWVYAPEPLPGPNVRLVPPSGHVAGMFARVDRAVGVHKPPANEPLDEVRGVERDIPADEYGWLNDEGVNAIRPTPARGVRVGGARTLVPPGRSDLSQWRYVHVRRLLLLFAEAIDRGTQWVVFAGNTPDAWRDVDRVVRTFLTDQWRRGRLDGATAADAFQVVCDRTTTAAAERDAGRMICEVRVRPPHPAELVIVRLGRRDGETGVVELAEADRG